MSYENESGHSKRECPDKSQRGVKSSFCFRRKERLKRRIEIREVFNKGSRYNFRGAKLFVLKNDLPHNRICFTCSASKSGFKTAVQRNRAKRLGREAFRLLQPRLSGGHDLILLVYPEQAACLSDRLSQVEFLLTKAGLLK